MTVTTPHFALPFRIAGSSPAVNEQDTADDVRDCVEAIVRTPVGSRVEQPDFGVPDLTFGQLPLDTASLAAAVSQWEPRAEAEAEAEGITLPDYISTVVVQIQGGQP